MLNKYFVSDPCKLVSVYCCTVGDLNFKLFMKSNTEMDRYWQNIELLRNFIKNLENILFLELMH